MKKAFIYIFLLFCSTATLAQDTLPTIPVPADLTVHFISPQPIQYVDISDKKIVGDLALPNVLRLRLKDSSKNFCRAVVTIAGQNFMAQYKLVPGTSSNDITVNILPVNMRPLDISGIGLNENQLHAMALNIISRPPEHCKEKVKVFDIRGQLNHIYTIGDYIFLDVSYRNDSRLRFDIDAFRFKIDDKKVTKASNAQSLEVKPLFVLDNAASFSRSYRNVFVFKKISFPGNKVLDIELSEKQLSGRVLTLRIAYKDILDADNLPD